jgi:hypothetical protein
MSLASFSPYFFLFGCEPKLLASICLKVMVTSLKLHDLNVWMCAYDERTKLVKKVIPMACEKLAMFNIETH